MIHVRQSSIPLQPGPGGYVKRYRGGATVVLDRAQYTEDQCAKLQGLFNGALGEGVITWWDGELVQDDESAPEPDLQLGQPVM